MAFPGLGVQLPRAPAECDPRVRRHLDKLAGALSALLSGLTGALTLPTDRLLGRDTAGTGAAENISVTGGIEFTGSQSIRTTAFTGDVTKTAGGTALTIANDAVTYAKMQDIATAKRVIGSGSANSTPSEISASTLLDWAASTNGDLLRRTAGSWGALGIGSEGRTLGVSSGLPTWLGGRPVRVYPSGSQSINDSTLTAVTWDSEQFDEDGWHSTVSNTSRLTAPAGDGTNWLPWAWLYWDANATGVRIAQLLKGGTTNLGITAHDAASAGATSQIVVGAYPITNGEYVEVHGYQTSGGPLNVNAANLGALGLFWIGN